MTKIGYARVSTDDQNNEIQISTLKAAGCEIIRQEIASGTTTEGRPELATVLDFLRDGDTLVVTRIDRLARSMMDLLDIARAAKAKGANITATEQPFSTDSIYGELTMNLLGCFAQFETQLRRERQMEGIAKAKAEGVYQGRKPKIDASEVQRLHADGLGASAIAKALKISRASVYRSLPALASSPDSVISPN